MTKTDETPSRSGRGRAAKLQAKIKLDIQARELAELNRQAQSKQASRSCQNSAKKAPQPLGTRVSARLRGVQTSEWQPIPDEWLETRDAERSNKFETRSRHSRDKKQTRNDQEDSVSELTELSDDSDNLDTSDEQPDTPKEKIIAAKDEDGDSTIETGKAPPEGFVEWETVGSMRPIIRLALIFIP